jgi:eukaryotic-like serine/threonine-protein kinase
MAVMAPLPDTDRSTALESAHRTGQRTSGLVRGERIDRYVLVKTVGAGGMGVVYAAYDPELDRKVALKLLRTDPHGPAPVEGQSRLLREAKAMARVTHPHVCAVYDAGLAGGQIFVAMELVDGSTLHEWLEAPGRSWREVLRVFIAAGQGLAAAHQAGLVHRDFKPGNVLIGHDGRVRVTDFGLARLVAADRDVEPRPGHAPEEPPVTSALASPVTQAGVAVGTPAYMPPEQYLGIPPDARSDQFSFCAALFWALYRQRPFEPRRIFEAAQEMAGTGQAPSALERIVQEPPRDAKVPPWVRRAVLRGLSLRPEERFASMQALLAELSQELRLQRRRRAVAGAGLAVVVVAGAVMGLRRGGPVCEGAEHQVAQVWNPAVREGVTAAFLATAKPFAPQAAQSVGRVLDAYARDWAREHTAACEATRVRGVQTEQLLSLQVVCLERRRKELGALAQLLTQADARVVRQAVDLANSLPSLRECQDLDALSSQEDLPEAPALRARVEQLRGELAEIKLLGRAGRYEESVQRALRAEPGVAATGYRPLQAELDAVVGWVQQLMGNATEGARRLEQAVNVAETARADRLKADALLQLLFVRGLQGEREQAGQWGRLAASAIARLGGDAELTAKLQGNLGSVALNEGRYEDARRHFEQERELEQGTLPEEHLRRIRTTYNLGLTALLSGDPARAVALLGEALRRREAVLGDQHPEVALCHAMLSWAYRDSGDAQRGLEHAQRAVAIREAVFGPEHAHVADALDGVGMSLLKLRRYDAALQTFERALAMKQKVLGAGHPDLSYSYDGMGQTLLASGQPRKAIAPLEKALSFEGVGPEPLAESGFALARALLESGRGTEGALAEARRARQRFLEVGKTGRAAGLDQWIQSHAQPMKASHTSPHAR